MERVETSLRAPAGVGQGVHGGSLPPPPDRWVIRSNMVKLTTMFLLHITQGFHMTIQHNMGVDCRRKLVFTVRNSPRMSITIGTNHEI